VDTRRWSRAAVAVAALGAATIEAKYGRGWVRGRVTRIRQTGARLD
jgi:hypothetical protein